MKQIMKQIPTNIYICEICNKEYKESFPAEQCEKRHAQETKQKDCKHSFAYFLEIDWDEHDLDIFKECNKCGLHERVHIDVEDDFTSEELGVVYDRLKQEEDSQLFFGKKE